jgi:ParB family chromosome partitioning protein
LVLAATLASTHPFIEIWVGTRLVARLESGQTPITSEPLESGEDAGEISLAENVIRLPMHPADQFEASHALAATGKGPEDIAGRFGCTPAVVRQRLKLAAVSPHLIDLYRAEEMDLDLLMAFTVSDDHAAQEAAWFGQPAYNRPPGSVRRILTAHVEARNRGAVGRHRRLCRGGRRRQP